MATLSSGCLKILEISRQEKRINYSAECSCLKWPRMRKKSCGFRPIINLKPLNQWIRNEHFKIENLESDKHVVKRNDWFTKLDLEDAYLTVPIGEEH